MTSWLKQAWSAIRVALGVPAAPVPLTPSHGWLLPQNPTPVKADNPAPRR
jgi:hypothetical protein